MVEAIILVEFKFMLVVVKLLEIYQEYVSVMVTLELVQDQKQQSHLEHLVHMVKVIYVSMWIILVITMQCHQLMK